MRRLRFDFNHNPPDLIGVASIQQSNNFGGGLFFNLEEVKCPRLSAHRARLEHVRSFWSEIRPQEFTVSVPIAAIVRRYPMLELFDSRPGCVSILRKRERIKTEQQPECQNTALTFQKGGKSYGPAANQHIAAWVTEDISQNDHPFLPARTYGRQNLCRTS